MRSLKQLAVVEIVLVALYFFQPDDAGKERLKKGLVIWRGHLVQILKDSPSEERKFLRWKLVETPLWSLDDLEDIVIAGELEVFPETSL